MSAVKEKAIMRRNFVKLNRAGADDMHEVVFAVKQNNIDQLESLVAQMSTPGHDKYQKWMTYDEIGHLVTNNEGFNAITTWLSEFSTSVKIMEIAPRLEYFKVLAKLTIKNNKNEEHEFDISIFNN